VIVVSHRPEPDGWRPEASRLQPGHPHPREQYPYYFVNDVAKAIEMARELAGERTVAVAAGEVGGQALALGLVDEVAMDVVPVVFGAGKRYFGSVDAHHLLEDPHTVLQGDRVLHLRYKVRR
jgi:dihydrofolate reductase